MLNRCIALLILLFAVSSARAVYAPIPEEELGKAFVVRLAGGVYHDSNIFGSATDERDSMVYRLAPSFSYNSSVTPQTFVSLGYRLSFERVEERPLNKDLISHVLNGRLAHSFSEDSILDITNNLSLIESPESLLPGLPLNTDQSFTSNQLDATYTNSFGERMGYSLKGRSLLFAYDLKSLAQQLDRHEFLLGASLDYSASEQTTILGEYRFQDVSYDTAGALKDKQSHFLLGGMDYNPSEKLSLSMRMGLEQRDRSGAPDDDAPRAEVISRYSYGEKSFISGGYIFAIEEVSNVVLYTDIEVHRFFVNVQHALGANTMGSLFYNVEPSTLLGRPGVTGDQDETTQRFGAALTFRPRPGLTLAGTLDLDATKSDDANRELDRTRVGFDITWAF
ncbi:MAG: hypothetical protein SynsKO_04080 [Synoicihabitans sp.]